MFFLLTPSKQIYFKLMQQIHINYDSGNITTSQVVLRSKIQANFVARKGIGCSSLCSVYNISFILFNSFLFIKTLFYLNVGERIHNQLTIIFKFCILLLLAFEPSYFTLLKGFLRSCLLMDDALAVNNVILILFRFVRFNLVYFFLLCFQIH